MPLKIWSTETHALAGAGGGHKQVQHSAQDKANEKELLPITKAHGQLAH